MRSESAFTLMEMLVTMLITTIVFGATLSLFDVFQKNNRLDQLRVETQDNARNAIDRLARELRNVAAPSTEAAGALETAEHYAITFQTVDTSSAAPESNATDNMRVRYCLAASTPTNEVLYKQVLRWKTKAVPALPTATACPDTVAGDFEATTRLGEHVVNRIGGQDRPLFTFGPATATTVSGIVSIEPTLYLDSNPGSKPGESQLTTTIALRNQNRPPTAAFTAIQQGTTRVVELSASESADPDGLALTYAWWDNGVKLNTTAQQYKTEEEVQNSKHVFKLEVTDPGGLKSEATKEVTIK